MGNTTKLILAKLKEKVQTAIDCNEDMDAVSWGMQEGVLISCNDAKLIIELIEKSEIDNSYEIEIFDNKRNVLQKIKLK